MRAQFGGAGPAAGEAARHCRYGARPADRPQPCSTRRRQRLDLDVRTTSSATRSTTTRLSAAGRPFRPQLFDAGADMNQLTEDQLVARLRHDIPRSDLLQAVTAGVAATPPGASTCSIATATRSGSPTSSPSRSPASPMSASRARPICTKFYEAQSRSVPRPRIPRLHRAEPRRRAISPRPSKSPRTSCGGVRPAQGRVRDPRAARGRADPGAVGGKGKGGRGGAGGGQGLEGGRDENRRAGPGHDRSRPLEAQGDAAANSAMSHSNCRSTSRAIRSRRRSAGTSCGSSRSSRPRRKTSSRPSRSSKPS